MREQLDDDLTTRSPDRSDRHRRDQLRGVLVVLLAAAAVLAAYAGAWALLE